MGTKRSITNLSRLLLLLLLGSLEVYATIQDVPSLNGPIMMVPQTPGSKTRTKEFQHPGLWHSHDDLEIMRTNALGGVEPWASEYKRFSSDPYAQASYEMKGPHAVISRGVISNYSSFESDVRAAYQNAIMWYITKDQGHWNTSTSILDAWGTNLTDIIGIDRSLLVGIDGAIMANAAEIMRWEGGWVEQGAKWQGGSGFSIQLYWLFARQSIIIGQANYGLASIVGLLNFAVYLDDLAMYNYALYAYKYDLCAGLSANLDSATGQSAESGRDQAHVQDGLQWFALASQVVKNQGYDLYSLDDNLIFTGAEYTAKYNLNQTVPYDPEFYRCEAVLVDGPWDTISEYNRYIGVQNGKANPAAWGLIYYAAKARNLDVPWTFRAKQAYDTSVQNQTSPTDLFSWADLLFAVKTTN